MAIRPPKNTITDPKTGVITREWLAWLQEIADAAIPITTTPPGTPPASTPPPGTGGGGGGAGSDYGTGTAGKITKWLAAHELGDSIMSELGDTIVIDGGLIADTISGRYDPSDIDTGGVANAFFLTDASAVAGFHSSVPFTVRPSVSNAFDLGLAGSHYWRNSYLSGASVFTNGQAAPSVMTADTAAFYAADVSGTVRLYAIDEAGVTGQVPMLVSWPTAGSVLFASANGRIDQDNANLFWDDTNNRLWVGIDGANARLKVNAATAIANATTYGIEVGATTSTTRKLLLGYDVALDAGVIQSAHLGVTFAKSLLLNASGGNVGVGATNATARLTVKGATSSAGSAFEVLNGNDTQKFLIGDSGVITHTIDASTYWRIAQRGTSIIGWLGNATDYFFNYNTATQQVTVGNSSTFGSRFGVTGNASIGTTYVATAAPTNGLIVEGNVGIGTLAPDARLQVAGELHITGGSDTRFNFSTQNFIRGITHFDNAAVYFLATGLNNPVIGLDGTGQPSAGTATLVFADGIAPSSLASNTAAIYAEDVGGTVKMFVISEAGVSGEIATVGGAGVVGGSGTTGKVPKWSSSSALTDSIMTETTGNISVAGSITLNGPVLNAWNGTAAADGNVGIGVGALAVVTGPLNTALGYHALAAVTTGRLNVAVGYNTLPLTTTQYYNTAIGAYALASCTTGESNTALGAYALWQNTTGMENVALGGGNYPAMAANVSGSENVAIGRQAVAAAVSANGNTGVGYRALRLATSSANTAFGHDAGASMTTGTENVCVGFDTGIAWTTGSNNTGVGARAGGALTTGNNNAFVGWAAGQGLTTGTYNTIIGSYTGSGLTTGNYNTIIGAYVGVASPLPAGLSNTIILADGQGNQRLYVDSTGKVGIGTTTPVAPLTVKGPGGGGDVISVTNSVNSVVAKLFTTGGAEAGILDLKTNAGAYGVRLSADPAGLSYILTGNVGIGTASPTNKLSVGVDLTAGFNVPNVAITVGYAGGTSGFSAGSSASNNVTLYWNDATGKAHLSTIRGSTSFPTTVTVQDANIGIGVTTPTARLHLAAGTTTASTAPLKFNSGPFLTTPEVGAVEFLTDAFYGTITTGAARKQFLFADGSGSGLTNVALLNAANVFTATQHITSGASAALELRANNNAALIQFMNAAGSGTWSWRQPAGTAIVLRDTVNGVDHLTFTQGATAAAAFAGTLAWGGGSAIASSSNVALLNAANTFTATPQRMLVSSNAMNSIISSNQDTGASAYSALVAAAYGNSWAMRNGSVAANVNTLEWAVDALGTPIVRMSLSTAGLLSVSGFGTHTFGSGGGTSGIAEISMSGGSGSAGGGLVRFQRGATTVGWVGAAAALVGGTTDSLALYAPSSSISLYTNALLRWGINAAGDWTYGASGNIAFGTGTPNISSGGGTGASIVGTSHGFRVTVGSSPGSSDIWVPFGRTFASVPSCTTGYQPASSASNDRMFIADIYTTQIVLRPYVSWTAGDIINVNVHGF